MIVCNHTIVIYKTCLTNMNNSSKHDSVEVGETVKVQLRMHNKDDNCNTYQFLPMGVRKADMWCAIELLCVIYVKLSVFDN